MRTSPCGRHDPQTALAHALYIEGKTGKRVGVGVVCKKGAGAVGKLANGRADQKPPQPAIQPSPHTSCLTWCLHHRRSRNGQEPARAAKHARVALHDAVHGLQRGGGALLPACAARLDRLQQRSAATAAAATRVRTSTSTGRASATRAARAPGPCPTAVGARASPACVPGRGGDLSCQARNRRAAVGAAARGHA